MLNIDSSFIRELPADIDFDRRSRIVSNACFSYVSPESPSNPKLIHYSSKLLAELGLSEDEVLNQDFLDIITGSKIYPNTKPYAMRYGGHQFGQWAGQLGDGRAINLFEHIYNHIRYTFQLKGAGQTPYSRNADGYAVLRSSIREHLCSEAMYHLGIPTTRSLSLALSGDQVMRDMLYDGHPRLEKGAIICRVAPNFIRFGNFEILSAYQEYQNLKRLADYTIQYFYPHLSLENPKVYLAFFKEIVEKTAALMLEWQRVGFVHGVMNTDNMSIMGLTIDYGPYGWIEDYQPDWTPNTTDIQSKRYRFGQQPNIALWNLVQLANALYPLIEDIPAIENILNEFQENWHQQYQKMMADKLGISTLNSKSSLLIQDLERVLQLTETDFTIFFRLLGNVEKSKTMDDALAVIHEAFYFPQEMKENVYSEWQRWFQSYLQILKEDNKVSDKERKEKMNQINPKYILRNYMTQMAIDEAEKGDYHLIHELYHLLLCPYNEQTENEKWFAKRPEWARNKIGCSMLSCSS